MAVLASMAGPLAVRNGTHLIRWYQNRTGTPAIGSQSIVSGATPFTLRMLSPSGELTLSLSQTISASVAPNIHIYVSL